MSGTDEPPKLTREDVLAWRSFLTAHARITRQLEADLLAAHQLSLAAFDVFVQLSEAPGHCLRMTELAEAVLLSRSGLTRLVERLEKDGLVVRGRADGDGRGVTATLTPRGSEILRIASETHVRGIYEHFASRLNPVELLSINHVCERLLLPPRTSQERRRPI